VDGRSGESPRKPSSAGAVALSVAFAALFLLAPLGIGGAWDPYEIDAADLARRIAVHAFGASTLARSGDPSAIPTLGDLGMGELPFTSMALSFRLFGVHEWSGRLPLALFGIAAAASLAILMARLVSGRAAFASVVALVTMPLFFLEARMMLGDIVTMAGFAMAISGLGLVAIESAPRWRLGGLAWGALGLVVGFMSRGLLFGVAAPLVSVGLGALACARIRFTKVRARDGVNPAQVGAGLLTVGAFLFVGFLLVAIPRIGTDAPLSRVVGFALESPSPDAATFDRIVRQLGHALFPWSAVLPACLARLFVAPVDGSETDPRGAYARLLVLASSGISLLAATLVVPWAGALPFFGIAALAASIGIAADDLARGVPASRAAALTSFSLAVVLHVDLVREPWRALEGLTATNVTLPPAFDAISAKYLERGSAVFVVFAFFAWFDVAFARVADRARMGLGAIFTRWLRARRSAAGDLGGALVGAFQGNLVFVLVVVEAALVGLAATLYIGTRARWAALAALPRGLVSALVDAWWALLLGVVLAAAMFVVARDVLRLVGQKLRIGRGGLLLVGGAAAGALYSFAFYPALAGELSSANAFDTFLRVRRDGDQLALAGTNGKAGAFYTGADVPRFGDVGDAMEWLDTPAKDGRRFLLLRGRDLPRLNSLYRGVHGSNVPVVDARSSQTLLVASEPVEAKDQNPLADIVLDAPPPLAHRVDARFQQHLDMLGWDLVDGRGVSVTTISAEHVYRLRQVYRVDKRISGTWTAFVHLDGDGKRQNADHPVAHGRYPMALWQPGDIIVDEVELEIDPSFLPGDYWLLSGFFQGQTRLRVTEGPNQDDRVILGRIRVE
jgi:hypothetical protein